MRAIPVQSHCPRSRRVPLAVLLTGLIAFGCERETTLSPEDAAARLDVTPATAAVADGDSVVFTATAFTAAGDVATTAVRWSATGGSVSGADGANGQHVGQYKNGQSCGGQLVIATAQPSGVADTATVTVDCSNKVAVVEVTPAAATVDVGATVQLSAVAKDGAGNPLNRSPNWSSSNTAVATVSGSGLVTGVAAGAATITASSGGKSGSATITVLASSVNSAILVGAGDIADCSVNQDEATAKLLDAVVAQHPSATVFLAGDNAYDNGSASDYTNCYQPTWGRHKARSRPSPGNHEYNTSGASGYYNYFGSLAGPSGRGYYSYDIGAWHVISLNSEVSMGSGSAQEQWLRADLAASTKRCTIAYWHKPRFSSGEHGSLTVSSAVWNALYDAGAELVLVGHDHNYERFAPMTPSGSRDDARGIRQIVVGTGGRSLRGFGSVVTNSEVRNSSAHGVLKLTLSNASYTWEFIPIAGQSFRDSGSGNCH